MTKLLLTSPCSTKKKKLMPALHIIYRIQKHSLDHSSPLQGIWLEAGALCFRQPKLVHYFRKKKKQERIKEKVEKRREGDGRQEEGKGRQRERRTALIATITRTHRVSCALHSLSPCIFMVIPGTGAIVIIIIISLFSNR